MGWLRKNKKETKVKENRKVETDSTKKGETPMTDDPGVVNVNMDYPYIVQLNDVDGATTIRKQPFGAKRWIDGANVWLVNETVGFKEPFPDDTDEFKQYTIEELTRKLKKIDAALSKMNNKTTDTPLKLDLLQDKKVFRGYKKSLELQGKGSYLIISQEHGGRPLYTFDRKGNFKLPVYKNVDYSLLYVPNEADIAMAGDLLKLNEEKNGDKDNSLKLITVVLAVILGILIIGALYVNYKTVQIPSGWYDGMSQIMNNQITLTENLNEFWDSVNSTIEISPQTVTPEVNPGTVNVNN